MDKVLTPFKHHANDTGALTFIEAQRDIPFDIKRVYYIYNVEHCARRGFHAHRSLKQYLICVSGSCNVELDDGNARCVVNLNDPNTGLYVAPGIWHEMFDFSANAVLLVLASGYYDEADYIRDYGAFKAFVEMDG